jgi:hypothetical protein
MKISKGYGFRVVIGSNTAGITSIEISHISILEDLWHDYNYYKNQAKTVTSFRQKRCLRTAFIILFAYFDGVVNRWCNNQLLLQGKEEIEVRKYIRKNNIYIKCRYLAQRATVNKIENDESDMKMKKELRNELVHLDVNKDLDIHKRLNIRNLQETELLLISWLDKVGERIGEYRHPDTRKLGRKFADKGSIIEEEYTNEEE